MENEERNDEILQLIGYIDNWQLVENAGIHGINVIGERIIRPRSNAKVIIVHPRIRLATTNYDRHVLKAMFNTKQKLRFIISVATEEDEIVLIAKERLEKSCG